MSTIPRNVATNVTTRTEVYQAINTERDFQDSFVLPQRRYYQTHTLGEFVLMLNQYAAQAMQKWTHHSDEDSPDTFPPSLHEIRKLAAIAVRCMEQHGAPLRDLPKRKCAEKIANDEDDSVDLEEILEQLAEKDDIEDNEDKSEPLKFDAKTLQPLPRKRKKR